MGQQNSNMQKILFTTISLLKNNTYEDITIKDICTAAGISRQTFYNYFKSKDEIFKVFFRDLVEKGEVFSPDKPLEYYFSDRYLYDIISLYDKYSDIFIALYKQDILWYLGKEFVSAHKNALFDKIPDPYINKYRNYFYLYSYLTISYICLEWIKTGKKETKEELIEMLKYFSHFRM
ncbi:MAG: TetR/AcrR family transcriptional regulator [Oscillospiraceae bacterium]|nr:TetR/AcrR family transcriptional regulator [Oscillospiraceae bacterium]